MSYGEKLREARTNLGYTQKEFAKEIGTKQNTLSNFEKDISKPSSLLLSILFSKFNVSPYWFFDLRNPLEDRVEINDVLLEKAKSKSLEYGLSVASYLEHLIIEDLKNTKGN